MQMQMLDATDVENKMLGQSKGTYLVIGNLGFFRNLIIVKRRGVRHGR